MTVLDHDIRDRLLFVIESSLRVSSDTGFFLWSQGALQSIVPHEILICAIANGLNCGPRMNWYSSSRYFTETHFQAACDPGRGPIPQLRDDWFERGQPQFLLDGAIDEKRRQQLIELEMRNLVAHGVQGAGTRTGGYFCFCRTGLDASPLSAHLLDLVLPYLHSAFCRVLAAEAAGTSPRSDNLVSAREAQVLHLIKDGKTTFVIAETLSLSPYTVRNHVKNIFRKLGVKSRSHAVAKALSQGILIHPSQ